MNLLSIKVERRARLILEALPAHIHSDYEAVKKILTSKLIVSDITRPNSIERFLSGPIFCVKVNLIRVLGVSTVKNNVTSLFSPIKNSIHAQMSKNMSNKILAGQNLEPLPPVLETHCAMWQLFSKRISKLFLAHCHPHPPTRILAVWKGTFSHMQRNVTRRISPTTPIFRVIRLKISTGETDVLLNELYFPNGIQIMPDRQSVLVGETSMARIMR